MAEFLFRLNLPDWVEHFVSCCPSEFPEIEDRMRFVLELARRNIQYETGGPFGAAVFDNHGRMIAPGVNLVVLSNCSLLHAEMVAIAMAQQKLKRFDISDGNKVRFDLFATSEPCAMCFGAIHWSGIKRLVCGAREADAHAIGFDEGPKPVDWESALNDRGISVIRDVLRDDAISVLQDYMAIGGHIYNTG